MNFEEIAKAALDAGKVTKDDKYDPRFLSDCHRCGGTKTIEVLNPWKAVYATIPCPDCEENPVPGKVFDFGKFEPERVRRVTKVIQDGCAITWQLKPNRLPPRKTGRLLCHP